MDGYHCLIQVTVAVVVGCVTRRSHEITTRIGHDGAVIATIEIGAHLTVSVRRIRIHMLSTLIIVRLCGI